MALGPVGYAPGLVGDAFNFTGNGYVSVPHAPSLTATGPR